ncbi:hypothetical protein ACMFMG_006285 [Clarireedia jacksonii]
MPFRWGLDVQLSMSNNETNNSARNTAERVQASEIIHEIRITSLHSFMLPRFEKVASHLWPHEIHVLRRNDGNITIWSFSPKDSRIITNYNNNNNVRRPSRKHVTSSLDTNSQD